MYSRKSVGPRGEPWGTPSLTEYSSKTFNPKPSEAIYH